MYQRRDDDDPTGVTDMNATARRSLHFVPGANEKMLTKSLGTQADTLILDLEDAVTPDRKEEARQVVAGWLRDADFGVQERTVRMNPLDTPWGIDDLHATMEHPPDSYLVPKISTLDELNTIDATLTALEQQHGHPAGGVKLLVLGNETPLGALNLPTFCACPRVGGLSWGAEDLSAALGAPRNRKPNGEYLDVYKYCRVQTLLCAAAGGVDPIDTVFVDFNDTKGLKAESDEAAWMGFTGKITIHPAQIDIVNAAFTPSADTVAEAVELLALFEAAQADGRMAFSFRGQMVDVPHLTRAQNTVARAKQMGLEIPNAD